MLRAIGILLSIGLVGCSSQVAEPPAASDASATAEPAAPEETLTGRWTATMPEPETPAVSWDFQAEGRGILSLGEEELGGFNWQETEPGKVEIRMDDLPETDVTEVEYKFIRGELVLTGPSGTTRFARSTAPAKPATATDAQEPTAEESETATDAAEPPAAETEDKASPPGS